MFIPRMFILWISHVHQRLARINLIYPFDCLKIGRIKLNANGRKRSKFIAFIVCNKESIFIYNLFKYLKYRN